jgi:hypothetical protein
MEEKTYTLNIRQTGQWRYEVTIPETGVTKTAPTLDSALTITLHDIVKHLTTRYLILVFVDQRFDETSWFVDPQERAQTDLEQQAAFEVEQLGIAPQVKRREHHLVFELSHPLTREQPPGSMSMRESSSRDIRSKMSLKSSSMHCWRKHMKTGRQQPMSEHPPTLLIVYLPPDHDEAARYHIDETLATAGIAYRVIAQQEERVSLESAAPFVITHHEKRMVFALRAALDPKAINDIAYLVTTGLILGFTVKGEIALGGEVGAINNLGG